MHIRAPNRSLGNFPVRYREDLFETCDVETPSHRGRMPGAGQNAQATAFIDAEISRLLASS